MERARKRAPRPFFSPSQRRLVRKIIKLSLKAYWRRLKQFRSPWSPYLRLEKREIQLASLDTIKRSEEKYLRATLDCDPYAPEIVGMARSLAEGCRSKREYAEKIFEFVKSQIIFTVEKPSKGAADTLRRGYGVCFEKLNLFVALARAGGIRTRYVQETWIPSKEGGAEYVLMAQFPQDPEGLGEEMERIYLGLPTGRHFYAEVLIGGQWLPADPTWEDERMAGHDLPIMRLGDHPQTERGPSPPVTTEETVEGIPPLFGPTPVGWRPIRIVFGRGLFRGLFRGLWDYVNAGIEERRRIGRRKLDEMGRDAYIESKKKFYVPVPPRIHMEHVR